MKFNLARNCPDEQVLLDYLVGELGPADARDVQQHLKICTDCALSADQLSEDFADVGRAIEVELPLPPLRLAAARARVQAQQEEYESARAERPGRAPLGGTWARMALAAAVAILLVGAAATLYRLRDRPGPTAEQALARAQESISTYGMRPSMARYQVEIAQLGPESVNRKHQLVIWTDPNSGGYASRLENTDGSLRHAVWRRASDGPAFSYDQAAGEALMRIERSGQDSPPTLLASMGNDIDCDVLATGFARWLERRRWHPLRVSRDFALLASNDATLRLERSGDALLVVVRKQEGDLRAEITLTLGAQSYEPHSLQIRFKSPLGESTFKLVQNEVRFLAAAHLDASVFEARVPSPEALRTPSATAPRKRPERASDAPDPQSLEATLRHALHQAGACLGEPVEVVRGTDGTLAVRGIVGTSGVKAAILTELERSGVPDSVSLDIRTRAEAISMAEGRVQLQGPSARPGLEAVSPSSVRSLLLEADLIAYFRTRDPLKPADSVGRDLSAFAGEAVDRADDLLRSAWALRRLAERYGPRAAEILTPEAGALVREMCQDHLQGLAAASRKNADWTLPALDAIAVSRGVEAGPSGAISQSAATTRSWPDSFLSLFEAANSIHRDTLALLTVRMGASEVPASGAGRDPSPDVETVDQTLRRLLATSRAFGGEVTRTTDAFAAGSDPAPAAPLARGALR